MQQTTLLDAYARAAVQRATYEEMGDGSVVARVPDLVGVIAFGATQADAERELASVVEDWAWMRARDGRHVPVLDDVDLNTQAARGLIAKGQEA